MSPPAEPGAYLYELKGHYLSRDQAIYLDHHEEEEKAKTDLTVIESKYKLLQQEENQLKKSMRTHGPAAEKISKLVCAYLGRSELEIVVTEDGYELRRDSEPIKGSLSEGEKTAIALCYFLSTLEANGRKLKDLIVVVDDPVSSLDTRALNYSFSILKSALSKVAQLFLLTHNLHFMNEAKKWLKSKADPKDNTKVPTATLLFLDAICTDNGRSLSTSIIELPPYIKEYESEYQYLFHLVLRFVQSQDNVPGYFFLMPNALRKVLEVFLAFKFPGSEGLSTKMDNLANNGKYGLDGGHILALNRLIQVGSHADNLDDLITFSSMTIEETKSAANSLLKIMENLDSEHYRRLRKICQFDSSIGSTLS